MVATAKPQQLRPRVTRRVNAVTPARSAFEIQVARNVTAILRGIRRAELDRTAEAPDPCEDDHCD